MNKTIKMFLMFVCISLPLIISGDNFDPDLDICQNTLVDGAVFADDGNTYIFKGKYFWQMNPLNTNTGNIGFATLASTKWSEVSGHISAAFTAKHPTKDGLVTVFAVNNKWVAYEKGAKVMDGSISEWPGFEALKVTATFERVRGYSVIMALHSDNKKYSFFDFTTLNKPINLGTFDTWIRGGTLFFVDNNYTVPGHLVFIAPDKYCVINLVHKQYEAQCKLKASTSKLIGCPINISKRPTTLVPIVPIVGAVVLPEGDNSVDSSDMPGAPKNGTVSTLMDNDATVYAIIVIVICITIVVIIIIVIISKILNKRPKGTVSYIK